METVNPRDPRAHGWAQAEAARADIAAGRDLAWARDPRAAAWVQLASARADRRPRYRETGAGGNGWGGRGRCRVRQFVR